MSVVIRLKREGRKNLPSYRISVADPRAPRDGAVIEKLGFYDPRASSAERETQFNKERAEYWIGQGARLSPTVRTLLRDAGVTTFRPKPEHDRSGRKAKTATKARRESAKAARVAAKAARPKRRRQPKKDEKAKK
ncbi:MAG: 30S ribosomal protein S16 [Planctomycetes bacterium]|nr:30S ribosomal protein S16 [Planctomycetota bacterium]